MRNFNDNDGDYEKSGTAFSRIEPDAALESKILERIEDEQMNRKAVKKSAHIALIAAAVAVIGTATAFAAGGAISYFSSDKARELTSIEELSKYNSEVGVSDTLDGYTLTLDNVAADDNYIHVFYTVTSETHFNYLAEPTVGTGTGCFGLWSECIIDNYIPDGNHTSTDGYFADEKTYKGQIKYNIAAMDVPDDFKLELILQGKDSNVDLTRFTEDDAEPLTDEEKARLLYVSAQINKSDVRVDTITKDINREFAFTDPDTGNTETGEITKLIYSPFGTQLVVKDSNEAWGAMCLAGMALFDENGQSIDILNTDLSAAKKGSDSYNSLELMKVTKDTKRLTFVPILHDESYRYEPKEDLIQKIGTYPLTYKLSDYGSIVVTDVRITDGQIEIDYYKDGFTQYDPGFNLLDDNGNNAEPGGKLGCVLYTDAHTDTNSYTARYIYDAFDKNGNRIPPDDSVSKENIEKSFTTLEVYADGGITLDYDNAFTIELK